MIIDDLYAKVKQTSPLCTGLDLRESYIPADIAAKDIGIDEKLFLTAQMIIDATAEFSACYKVQIACYEALGLTGLKAYSRILKYLRDNGHIVIADIKRGDITSTAEEYAKGHFSGDFEADIVTLNPYMGIDAISPYFPYFKDKNKGAFVLVKTSNKSSEDFQEIDDSKGEKIYIDVLEALKNWGVDFLGNSGYSAMGAVVGVNFLHQIPKIRQVADGRVFMLVPGFGAQGAKAEDIAALIGQEQGGVVNVSRGIIAAHVGKDGDAKTIIHDKAKSMAEELLSCLK
ncbi:MAG: orotidine-5'-phosphate decarboxylase [Alphaproteobacteria bacterium]|nr:orotidine-5'-phosphate decarboxylase [Alphaproteobacteria bacterium]